MFNILISGTLSYVLNIVLIFLFILIGGILPLYERKFLALTQRRVGPKYVGYKGRLQFLADSLKVLFKNYLYLLKINRFFFWGLPVLFFNINLFLWLNIVWFGNLYLVELEYNLVIFFLISVFSHILMFFTGLISKNKYTIIASSRIINIIFIEEIFIGAIFTYIYLVANSFSFTSFIFLKHNGFGLNIFICVLPLLILLFLMDTGKTPFDLVEAETEIVMGYHVEYSGFLFGLFVLTEYLHVFFFSYVLFLFFI